MIEKMHKILFVGPYDRKNEVLKVVQREGVVEIKPIVEQQKAIEINRSRAEHIIDTYNFIREYKTRAEKSSLIEEEKEPDEICEELCDALQNYKKMLFSLRAEEEHIQNNIKKALPWGQFDLTLIKEIMKRGNTCVQFWETSANTQFEYCQIPEDIIVEKINTVDKRTYFMTLFFMPVKLEHCEEVIFEEDISMLTRDLENNLEKQRELERSVIAYVPYMDTINYAYKKELDTLAFQEAQGAADKALDGMLFILQGWCPDRYIEKLKKSTKDIPVELINSEPEPGEKIPTFMVNNQIGALGEDLVNLYDTPSYKDWDPSLWVFFSFTLFFAMIMADGGYGLLLLLAMLFTKYKLKNPSQGAKNFITLSLVLSSATVIYGLASGGFFGLSPENKLFGWLVGISLFDPLNIKVMMNVSIIIGMLHVSISLILKSVRLMKVFKNYIAPVSHLAWIGAIWSFYVWYGYSRVETDPLFGMKKIVLTLFVAALVVIFFTSAGTFKKPVKVLFGGLGGPYNGVQFFSDILSYLRLFALGMAGTLLAQTFNNLASDVWEKGIGGIILAFFIFLIGHGINILLCVMGGVIHGLRLNFLEWYRWSFDGDGRAFKPFRLLVWQK